MAKIIEPGVGRSFDFGGLGVAWKVDGTDTDFGSVPACANASA